jgi:Zn-dependent membrane protease YugP
MLKSGIRPIAGFSSKIAPLAVAAGLASQMPLVMDVGIICYGVALLVSLITLPCEFNASKRGLAMLQNFRVIDKEEAKGAKKVLKAAALTYVAATLTSIGSLATIFMRKRKITRPGQVVRK